MKVKIILGISLSIILYSLILISSVPNVSLSAENQTIYIRSDGRIEPADAPIKSLNNVTYTLLADISGSIIAERDNIIINGSNHVIRGTGRGIGIDISERKNVTIINVEIQAFSDAIWLYKSANNSIKKNRILNNNFGIWVGWYSQGNIICWNNISNNKNGIWIEKSFNNHVYQNNFTNNEWYSIKLAYSQNNIIEQNNLIKNEWGISMESCKNNIIINNNIEENQIGVFIKEAFNNSIYGNNFLENGKQVLVNYTESIAGSSNIWNHDYPLGGNYWSDYNGFDKYFGPYQNESGSDGIGDTSYIIDKNNVDNYPLMGIISTFNVSGYQLNIISNFKIQKVEYFKHNSSIVIFASNTANNNTLFYRLEIPSGLLTPPYSITINGTIINTAFIYQAPEVTVIYLSHDPTTNNLRVIIVPESSILAIATLMFFSTIVLLGKVRKISRLVKYN